jgi:hypothetical protein
MTKPITSVDEMLDTPDQTEVSTNPLDYLTEEQSRKQFARFNNSWVKSHKVAVDSLILQTGLSFHVACFIVALREDSDTLISNELVSSTVDTMLNQTRNMFGSEEVKKAALHDIQRAYDKLDSFQKASAGKRLRKEVLTKNNRADGNRILDAIMEKLEVTESSWC